MDGVQWQRLAFPAVLLLIAFLAFSSQLLFTKIEPGPLRKGDSYLFNALVAGIYLCYTRACFTDPGRIPVDWQHVSRPANAAAAKLDSFQEERSRWCRRCSAHKPPRAHHCKTCKRCIPKMDHHCVWTANCVSHITLPHFVRFLFYAVVSMAYLEYFLYERCAVIWRNRTLPSYLGPSVSALVHLFLLVVVNSLVLFALSLLLGRTLWSLSLNMTTIEGWEVERHEALLRRQRALGGYLDAPNGTRVHVERQEFPWDVGIWTNLCSNLGGNNPILWLWPFARSPSIGTGLTFQHNEIEDPNKPWPPPDPDRMYMFSEPTRLSDGPHDSMDVASVRQRQAIDQRRYRALDGEYLVRRKPFHERYAHVIAPTAPEINGDDLPSDEEGSGGDDSPRHHQHPNEGEEGWRNKDGERLADFGVEEDVEFYDEDDLPLADLLRLRRQTQPQVLQEYSPKFVEPILQFLVHTQAAQFPWLHIPPMIGLCADAAAEMFLKVYSTYSMSSLVRMLGSEIANTPSHFLMENSRRTAKDYWSTGAYSSAAGFVPKLTTTVLSYLDVRRNDRILDIGCGDGQLTAKIAAAASPGQVLGLDASPSFISTATSQHSATNCSYELQDCTNVAACKEAIDGGWDKVFSNAALHWILRNPATRSQTLQDIHAALKPGGRLVFEMGGKGNCAEIQSAVFATLIKYGVSIASARNADPWFFPSTEWMRAELTRVGFDVETCELEYRPTKLTQGNVDQSGGLEGWLKLMCARHLETVDERQRDQVIRDVCDVLETIITREEDGSRWIGYVRLRAVATKK